MNNYSKIANKYMKENLKRSILTTTGIVLATILIFAIGTFLLSFRDSMIDDARNNADYEYSIEEISKEEAFKVKENANVKSSAVMYSNVNEVNTFGKTDDKVNEIYGNLDYFNKILKSKLTDGEFPSASNEIIIDKFSSSNYNLNIGDKITLSNNKEYIIKGIMQSLNYNGEIPISIVGLLDDGDTNNTKGYSVYVNLKAEKDKHAVIDKIIEEANISLDNSTIEDNSSLLYLLGNGGNEYITNALVNIVVFFIIIIVICTVTVIYNSFNISVLERIKYYGILKAIGATHKQIKRIIFKEGILMGIIAYPIGCVLGYFILKYGVKFILGDTLMMIDFNVHFYKEVLLYTGIVVALTIIISLIVPARKARKISAVDAMRNKNEIRKGKIRKRNGKIIGKIFGIEGNLAYKNLKRTPIRFILTTMALTISIVMFNVFYGFMDFGKQIINQQLSTSEFQAMLYYRNGNTVDKEEIEEIKGLGFANNISLCYEGGFNSAMEVDKLNDSYYEKLGIVKPSSNDYMGFGIQSGEGIKLKNIGSDDLKDGGVILVDGTRIRKENGDYEILRKTNYKVSDKIKIPLISEDIDYSKAIENKDFVEVTIKDIIYKDPIYNYESFEPMIYFSNEGYKKVFGDEAKYNLIGFDFNNDEDRLEAAKYFSKDNRYVFQDYEGQKKEIEILFKQIEFFVYSFIIVISLISILNIFNTISTNLLIRKKEFSTLKAIGMTNKQLFKSIILEGTLYGIISAIIGGIASMLLLKLLISISGGIADIEYHFGYIAFTISIIVAVLITFISTIIPLRRLNKITIVEGITDEE